MDALVNQSLVMRKYVTKIISLPQFAVDVIAQMAQTALETPQSVKIVHFLCIHSNPKGAYFLDFLTCVKIKVNN